jgi:vacuolar-type H+-ATPase subunit C/Vma6
MANKSIIQTKLEEFTASVNPMQLVIGSDTEYEDEIRMFLAHATPSMTEDALMEVLRDVFRQMFNLTDDAKFLDRYVTIIREYIRLSNSRA